MSGETSLPHLGFYEKATSLNARAVEAMIADEKARLLEDIRGRAETWRTAGDPSIPLDLSALGATIPLALIQALDALAGADNPVAGVRNLDLSNNGLGSIDLTPIAARLSPTDLKLSHCNLTTLGRLPPSLIRLWISNKLVGLRDNPLPEGDLAALTAMEESANRTWTGKPPVGAKLPDSRIEAWLDYPKWAAWAEMGPNQDSRKDAIRRVVDWIAAGNVEATLDLSGLGLTSLPPDLPATVFKLDIKGNALQRPNPSLVERAITHCEIEGGADSLRPEDLQALAAMAETANQPWHSEDPVKTRVLPPSRHDAWRGYPAWSAWADAAEGPNERRRDAVDRLVEWIAAGNVDATLDLSGLGLTGLPPDLPKTIAGLDVARNGLTHVPPGLPATLETLDLSDNTIDAVDDAFLKVWLSDCAVGIKGNSLPERDAAALAIMHKTKSEPWRGVPKPEAKRQSFQLAGDGTADMGGSKAEAWQGYAAWSEWAVAGTSNEEKRSEAMQRLMAWTADGVLSEPLDLSGLGLTSLPRHLPARTLILKLDRNQLSTFLEREGEALQFFKLATEMSLTRNGLTSLPPLGPNVKILHADDNAIEVLGDTLPPKLVEISLRNNRLKDLGTALPFSVRKIDARGNPITTVGRGVMSLQISGCQLDIDDPLLGEDERTLVSTLRQAASTKLPAYRAQKDLLIGGQDTPALFKTLQATKASLAAIDFLRTATRTSALQKRGAKVVASIGIGTARQRLNEQIRSNEAAELNRSVTTRIGFLLDDVEPKLKALQGLLARATAAVSRLETDIDDDSLDIKKQYKSVESLCISVRSNRDSVQDAGQLIDPELVGAGLPGYDTRRWAAAWEMWQACTPNPLFVRLAEIKKQLPSKAEDETAGSPS